jgi:hypothetical protein
MIAVGNRETNLVAVVAVKANSVKRHLIVNAYHMLSNVEKEKLVLDLYYNQRKNVRQIAQEARISFRDIAAILKKKEAAGNGGSNGTGSGNDIAIVENQQLKNDNNNYHSEKATQAFRLIFRR